MLKKLLKYDFKAIFKYWWIAALTTLLLSVLGGACLHLLTYDREFPGIVYTTIIFVLLFVLFSYAAFSILSSILVFIRYYKNFFTDEGYLTFTLPVRRSQLLNSKLIASTTALFVTSVHCIVNIIVLLLVALAKEIFTQDFLIDVSEFCTTIVNEFGVYLWIYILEVFLFTVLYIVMSTLFLFCCITIASIITKKARLITAIGIYYAASSVVSFVGQILYTFGIPSLSHWLSKLPTSYEHPMVALIFFGIILFLAIFCMLLYTLQYWMLDRKLNLN